ncbi:hypothetical protein [Bernardetia sp.]|uniref:hypothetical protein n=1 Tax=Bernardetia sp. TaxID=1937974 RepID=UPI0025BA4A04|nr:hypothetical protein [Bernardetia sp.]
MKIKICILFLLVFAAIGQTIFLNIDAKSNFFDEQKLENSHTTLDKMSEENAVQSPEVVVTIRQHETQNDENFMNVGLDANADDESLEVSTSSKTKKPCSQTTKKERLMCQKAKEAEEQKRVMGSNFMKNSTIQTPMP